MTKEELQQIREIMQEELTPINKRLDKIEGTIEEIRDSTNYLAEWVEGLEGAFKKHEITGKG